MKKICASIVIVTFLSSTLITNTQAPLQEIKITASGSAQVGNLQAQTSEPVITPQNSSDITTFIAAHKRELAVLAIAITIGLSLKYCPWVQGLVGIDTEDEIEDWRVFIQK